VQVQGISGKRLDTGATITNGAIFLGTESSRQLNAITTKESQGKFSGEYSFGAHTITAGVEDIQTKYTNAFVQYTNGYYIFSSLANWQAGTPIATYQLARPFAGSTINDAIARWKYNAYGVFIQDTLEAHAAPDAPRRPAPRLPGRAPEAAGRGWICRGRFQARQRSCRHRQRHHQ
jgi:hypothetical protein